jgi:hypothetical protein
MCCIDSIFPKKENDTSLLSISVYKNQTNIFLSNLFDNQITNLIPSLILAQFLENKVNLLLLL